MSTLEELHSQISAVNKSRDDEAREYFKRISKATSPHLTQAQQSVKPFKNPRRAPGFLGTFQSLGGGSIDEKVARTVDVPSRVGSLEFFYL